jgi:hypothetical protein
MATKFETESCSRCGGSGHYSYNSISGTRCFKCGGAKIVLTKRGSVARDYFYALFELPASEVIAGMFVHTHGSSLNSSKKWRKVEAVGVSSCVAIVNGVKQAQIELTFNDHAYCLFPSSKVAAARDNDHIEANLAAALEYQDTLTKQGKPKKGAH